MGNVSVDDLKSGMTLNSDVIDATGRLLVRSGTVINEQSIRVFRNRDVKEVDIQGVEEKVAEAPEAAESVQSAPPVVEEAAISVGRHAASVGNVLVDDLTPGMTLKSDVTDATGRIVVRSGTVINEVNIRVFRNRDVKEVDIRGVEEQDAETAEAVQSGPPAVEGAGMADSALTDEPAMEIEISKEDENKIKIMRAIPFFKPFTDRELPVILKTSTWLRCNTGDIILKEGAASERSFFVILKGSICIQKRVGVTNMKKTIKCLKIGEFFGEMSVITGEPRSADAVAEGETFVLKIDSATLNKDTDSFNMRSMQFKFYKAFCEIIAERLARTDEMAVKLS
ncbi:MAG: cyclic nucleotide-binding domain-containing protein [Nitrospirae bacterium]|nr:cyclic nucleotide-binding domain-containing protein [Nitrospirota bacterium]